MIVSHAADWNSLSPATRASDHEIVSLLENCKLRGRDYGLCRANFPVEVVVEYKLTSWPHPHAARSFSIESIFLMEHLRVIVTESTHRCIQTPDTGVQL